MSERVGCASCRHLPLAEDDVAVVSSLDGGGWLAQLCSGCYEPPAVREGFADDKESVVCRQVGHAACGSTDGDPHGGKSLVAAVRMARASSDFRHYRRPRSAATIGMLRAQTPYRRRPPS